MNFLRTPGEYFKSLPGYEFSENYASGMAADPTLRMHYVDEGPKTGPTFLCLHGQPTWSYLYRKMIPVFSRVGRVVAPDLFGFGKSDKPIEARSYSAVFHRESLIALVKKLDLRKITLVCQDWGGLLGLTLPMEMPDRFERLIVMNTALATGSQPLAPGFQAWRDYNNSQPDLDIVQLMAKACPGLNPEEAAAYAAPFPDAAYKAGVRAFPNLVPENPEDEFAVISRKALKWWNDSWEGLAFMAIGEEDPVIRPRMMEKLHGVIRGCLPALRLELGHFVPEEAPLVAAEALRAFESYELRR